MAIRIMLVGGSGYVGSCLIPKILAFGNHVINYDLGIFQNGDPTPMMCEGRLFNIKADIRDLDRFKAEVKGCKAVIHLACISNDPSFDLNPELGKSINWDCFPDLVKACVDAGVERFIYASSSSVYGVTDGLGNVVENYPCSPITDYSRHKWACERELIELTESLRIAMHYTIVRPGTICGYSPRQRFDLTVNRMVNEAYNKGIITVEGGEQMRANLHIKDMVAAYCLLLQAPTNQIAGQTFNISQCNLQIKDIAEIVRQEVELRTMKKVSVEYKETDDFRSYHICSDKFRKLVAPVAFNWPMYNVRMAVNDLVSAFQVGKFDGVDTFSDDRFHGVKRIKRMQKELA